MNHAKADTAALLGAIRFAAQCVDRRNTIPIIGMIRLDCADGLIKVVGTDLDMECLSECEADVSGPFSFMADPRRLANVLRFSLEAVVTISEGNADKRRTITVECDGMTVTWGEVCLVVDYPEFMRGGMEFDKPTLISEKRLALGLRATAHAISTEERRYYLNGVYLHAIEGALRLAATNGQSLARYDVREPWPFDPAILPRKAAGILSRAVSEKSNGFIAAEPFMTPGSPEVETPGGRKRPATKPWLSKLRFSGMRWSIASKLIDGTYPDYTRVIPTYEPKIMVSLSHTALRRFCVANEYALKINPDGGEMTIRSMDRDVQKMPCVGAGVSFGMDIRKILAITKDSGTVRIEGATGGDPFMVYTEDPDLLNIIMPLRI